MRSFFFHISGTDGGDDGGGEARGERRKGFMSEREKGGRAYICIMLMFRKGGVYLFYPLV